MPASKCEAIQALQAKPIGGFCLSARIPHSPLALIHLRTVELSGAFTASPHERIKWLASSVTFEPRTAVVYQSLEFCLDRRSSAVTRSSAL